MNVLSLFDGISCGQIALNRAGIKYDNYFASEIDKYAIQITQKNYPNTIQLGDITKINGYTLPKIDLIMGGSPCQGFSFYSKQLNFDDPRSKLFFEFFRLLNECKLRYFLFENVKMKKQYQDVITNMLGVEPILINSALLSGQNRIRLYWTNILGIIQPKDKNIFLKDILENIILYYKHNTYSYKRYNNINGQKCIQIGIANNINGHDFLKRIYSPEGKSPTLTAVCGGNQERKVAVDEKNWRKLTPIECERLQTIPDNYTQGVSNTQRYKCIGNAFTVDVIAHILKFMI